MELEIADHADRQQASIATKEDIHLLRRELNALELKMEERFGRLESKIEAQSTKMALSLFGSMIALATFLYSVGGHR